MYKKNETLNDLGPTSSKSTSNYTSKNNVLMVWIFFLYMQIIFYKKL